MNILSLTHSTDELDMDEFGEADEVEFEDVVKPNVSEALLFLHSSRIMKLTFLVWVCFLPEFSAKTGVLNGLGGSKTKELRDECEDIDVSGEVEVLAGKTVSLLAMK